MKKLLFLLSISTLILSSCDKINDPYEGISKDIDTTGFCGVVEYDKELNDTTYNDSTVKYRKLLMEEYTGHTCGNCPKFTKELVTTVETDLSEKAILLSIHAGNFAALDQKYTYDFRTTQGNELLDRYKVNSFPGLITSRANKPKSGTQWNTLLDSLSSSGVYDKPLVQFKAKNIYNETINKGQVKIDVRFLESFDNANFVIGVLISEDKIIAKQSDYTQDPSDVDDYEHRHVLRGSVTSIFGSSLISGNIEENISASKSFCYDLNPLWNVNNCSLILFVADANNNQVLQADEIHVVNE